MEHETIEDRIAYLYAEARLNERFRLFDTVALPCLRAQTDPDFTLIIVIGDQFPTHHRARLEAMIADVPQALIHAEPPRNQREVMKEVLNDARLDPSNPCVQFRYDDDDAVSVDFIARLRQATQDCAPFLEQNQTVAFDWNQGYIAEFGPDGVVAAEVYRPFNVAALAMYVKGDCRLTIMNFAHYKLPQFMPTVSLTDKAMFVRSHNSFNDSRQGLAKDLTLTPLVDAQKDLFRERFAIEVDAVRAAFSAP